MYQTPNIDKDIQLIDMYMVYADKDIKYCFTCKSGKESRPKGKVNEKKFLNMAKKP